MHLVIEDMSAVLLNVICACCGKACFVGLGCTIGAESTKLALRPRLVVRGGKVGRAVLLRDDCRVGIGGSCCTLRPSIACRRAAPASPWDRFSVDEVIDGRSVKELFKDCRVFRLL